MTGEARRSELHRMQTLKFNDVLNSVTALPAEDQDMLFEIVRRRRSEAWRKRLAKEARKAEKEFHDGKVRTESAEALVARLRAEWSERER